ncbi:lamin tail domain-containing protein [Streptomyces polygonati]|uniref:Lamin tail domain-containing protein n=1 Tax=Streptomyces polygonati TaxID=1617087 RepID=A0ABV8HFV9_9ACTN
MLRSRVFATAAVAAAAAGLAVAPTPAGAATGSVHLYEIYYNSPGSDTGSTASLNAEWVKITNSTSKAVTLTGWTLTDASRHVYTFPTASLAAGRTVAVHTGKGANTTVNRYQGRAAYVWNNDKDTATLRKSNGATVDTCSYNTTRFAYRWC